MPATIDLERSLLRTTALRDTLPLHITIVLDQRLKGESAFPVQRASRLAELRFTIKNNAGGASFPFKRVPADRFKQKGYSAETGLHLELLCDPMELLTASDSPISNLLEVWVHEKIWTAIQNDRSPASSKMRTTAVTMTTSYLLLSCVMPLLKDKKGVEEKSVIGQLLTHIEKQASLREGQLRRDLESDASLQALEPHIQNAWKFVTNAAKTDDESEEQL